MRCGWLAFAALALFPSAVHADEPVVLKADGPWQVDFGEKRCRMGRMMTSGANKALFYIEQWAPDREAIWGLAGKDLKRFASDREVKFAFSNGLDGSFNFLDGTFGDLGPVISTTSAFTRVQRYQWMGLSQIDALDAGTIDSLTVAQGTRSVLAQFGPMGEPLKVFNDCMKALVASWGLSLEEQARVTVAPRALGLDKVVRSIVSSYPRNAEAHGSQANFRLKLIVEADGSISHCALDNMTAADAFNEVDGPCQAFKRYAKFEPAQAADGSFVRSFYTTRIAYRIRD